MRGTKDAKASESLEVMQQQVQDLETQLQLQMMQMEAMRCNMTQKVEEYENKSIQNTTATDLGRFLMHEEKEEASGVQVEEASGVHVVNVEVTKLKIIASGQLVYCCRSSCDLV